MIDLITEAHKFQALCLSLNWEFCFIGGIAVQHWGEPRLTRDVDVSVLTGFGPEEDFISAILKTYQARLPMRRSLPKGIGYYLFKRLPASISTSHLLLFHSKKR